MNVKWTKRFMAQAELIAQSSKDPDHKVGAVIVDHERRMLGSGYNGFPRGVRDDPERYADKMVKTKLIVHAEPNAILNATRSVRDCTLVCTRHPCSECAKLIIQAGLFCVVCPALPKESSWYEDSIYAVSMFKEAGISLQLYVT